jgi:hypothetical protein
MRKYTGTPGRLGRFAALTVALTTAGLVAGCSTHSSSNPAAAIAPKAAGASGTASAGAPATPPSSSPTASPATTSPATASPATASPAPLSTAGNGTQLGAYAFQLTNGYSAPLGATAPTQAEIASGGSCDIEYNGEIYSCNQEKIVSLPNGSTPSYSACTTGTLFVNDVDPTEGNVFCIIETSGSVAGVSVASAGSTPNYYISVKVTVWQYVS